MVPGLCNSFCHGSHLVKGGHLIKHSEVGIKWISPWLYASENLMELKVDCQLSMLKLFNVVVFAGLREFLGILGMYVKFTTLNKLMKLRLN